MHGTMNILKKTNLLSIKIATIFSCVLTELTLEYLSENALGYFNICGSEHHAL